MGRRKKVIEIEEVGKVKVATSIQSIYFYYKRPHLYSLKIQKKMRLCKPKKKRKNK
jgi:hypothetical protein